MTNFNEHEFEKKLHLLKDSQESIQNLSAWCLQHKQHHKKIVASWLSVLKKVQIDHRLTLFYLANDVIQYSKRKNFEFVKSWSTALQRATPMVREDRVKNRILRIFKIWSERGVYDEIFISDLSGLLSTNTKKTTTEVILDPNDFQPSILINKLKDFEKVEQDTDLKLKNINDCQLQLSDAEALRSHLKDRRKGDDVVGEVDEGIERMQGYIKALQLEIKERSSLLEILDHATKFYTTQKGEAKMVANAYRSFGGRVKTLKRKLDELIPTLRDTSPVPSPDVNAPSPSPDSDIELPDDSQGIIGSSISTISTVNSVPPAYYPLQELANQSAAAAASANIQIGESPPSLTNDNCFSSFIGSGSLPYEIRKTLFGNNETTPPLPPPMPMNTPNEIIQDQRYDSEQGKPIEVIDSRPKVSLFDETFKIPPFLLENLKNLIPPGPPAPETPPSATPVVEAPVTEITYSTQPSFDYGQSTPTLESSISSTPLPPPPMPPSMFLEANFQTSPSNIDHGTNEDEWNTKLPPKFPTWTGDWENEKRPAPPSEWMPPTVSDTPESPPHYEKEGVAAPIEYDDAAAGDVEHRTLVVMPYGGDTDHRTMARNQRLKDIDHRNLITLTASPQSSSPLLPPPTPPSIWKTRDNDYLSPNAPKNSDADYRIKPEVVPLPLLDGPLIETKPSNIAIPPLLKSPDQRDNIESVDMEMSDDEDERKCHSSKVLLTPQSPDTPKKLVANRNLSPRKIPILNMPPTETSIINELNGNGTEPTIQPELVPTNWHVEGNLTSGNGSWPNPIRNGNRGSRGGAVWQNRQFSPRGVMFKQRGRGAPWRPSQVPGVPRGIQIQPHLQVQGLVATPGTGTPLAGATVPGILPPGQRFFRPRMQFTGQPRPMRGSRGRW